MTHNYLKLVPDGGEWFQFQSGHVTEPKAMSIIANSLLYSIAVAPCDEITVSSEKEGRGRHILDIEAPTARDEATIRALVDIVYSNELDVAWFLDIVDVDGQPTSYACIKANSPLTLDYLKSVTKRRMMNAGAA